MKIAVRIIAFFNLVLLTFLESNMANTDTNILIRHK